ncbi:MAG: hypothetical protein XXXJIFNMEKO3_00613 [Candidatus Erwinia impunctatus]|nr:hypothetical protein XXXJIFNMEKO_00613 [Culicoides impunctatus]
MKIISLGDAGCRVRLVQALISVWLEADPQLFTGTGFTAYLVGAIETLLDGVPEAIEEADEDTSLPATKSASQRRGVAHG